MNHEEFYQELADQRANEQIKQEQAFLLLLAALYNPAFNKLKKLVRSIYEKYSIDGKLQKEQLFRYNRDKAIKKEITSIHKELGKQELTLLNEELTKVIEEEHTYNLYLYASLGLVDTTKLKGLSDKEIDQLLKSNWSGRTIQEVVQENKNHFTNRTFEALVLAGTQGKVMHETINDVEKLMKSGMNRTMLTFQTEYTRKTAEVEEITAQNISVTNYKRIHIAVLDDRGCDRCRPLHGKIYEEGEAVEIPVHHRCRCRAIRYFDDNLLGKVLNSVTQKFTMLQQKVYDKWKREFGK